MRPFENVTLIPLTLSTFDRCHIEPVEMLSATLVEGCWMTAS